MEEHKSKTLKYIKKSLEFFLQPLLSIKKSHDQGDSLFQYLFFGRTEEKDAIKNAIVSGQNVTLVGNPGQGKTCLMHSLFIHLKNENAYYPINLDYREAFPRDHRGLLIHFVVKMRKYYEVIEQPLKALTEKTTVDNVDEQMREVTRHLSLLLKKDLSKILVIFLDDLDYALEDYYHILKNLFIGYAASDKASLILSVRKPLLNLINSDDELRQCYRIQPQEILLSEIDLRYLLHNRLKSIINFKKKASLMSRLIQFLGKKTLDDLLYELADINQDFAIEELPFSRCVYIKLTEMTYGNLRLIEQVLPALLEHELENHLPTLNEAFYDVYMEYTAKDRNLLLDLVIDKTRSARKAHNGNAILQIVLEYFYFNEIKDNLFFETMNRFGINEEMAQKALNKLISAPYFLLDPHDVYSLSSHVLIERYTINNKGRTYVTNILINDIYYSKLETTKSARSYKNEIENCK